MLITTYILIKFKKKMFHDQEDRTWLKFGFLFYEKLIYRCYTETYDL